MHKRMIWTAACFVMAACTAPEMSTPSSPKSPSSAAAKSLQDTPGDKNAYRLVWSDEFNKDGPLNDADWGYEIGFVRNQELQWYQRENAVCKDGDLVIEARRESRPNPRYVPPATSPPTTSAPAGRGRG